MDTNDKSLLTPLDGGCCLPESTIGNFMVQKYDPNITYPNDAFSAKCEEIDNLKAQIEKMNLVITCCKNDYWFMENLIERYGSDKEQVLKDCLERMKFRKPMFESLIKKAR